MPTSAYALLILGLFGIAWLVIAWRCHLPLQAHPAGAPKAPRLLRPRTPAFMPGLPPVSFRPDLPCSYPCLRPSLARDQKPPRRAKTHPHAGLCLSHA
jgi:hypothetical protein